MERRLAAILAADVVGYSRLMSADEAGTLAALRALRQDRLEPLIARHRGRVVNLMGDGFLVEFASAVDAVECALAWQRERESAEDRTFRFRIGVNLGDIIVEDGDIHGDGVNLAARLESLAEPGGVCISAGVHDQIDRRIDVSFTDIGEQQLKNIERPVRVWQWMPEGSVGKPASRAEPPAPAPTDEPSIAVLPFENMSGDPEQTYFADGNTDDIITELSKIPAVMVISRNSTFTYKGKAAKVRDVCDDLGVRYVLEGSVRKAGGRVRVSAQLIDGQSGGNLWAERYDEATASLRRSIGRNPEALWPHVFLAACLGYLEQKPEAAAELAEVRRINPDFFLASLGDLLPYKQSADAVRLSEGLRRAGLSI